MCVRVGRACVAKHLLEACVPHAFARAVLCVRAHVCVCAYVCVYWQEKGRERHSLKRCSIHPLFCIHPLICTHLHSSAHLHGKTHILMVRRGVHVYPYLRATFGDRILACSKLPVAVGHTHSKTLQRYATTNHSTIHSL